MNINGLTDFFSVKKRNGSATVPNRDEMTTKHWAILRMRARGMSFREIADNLRDPITGRTPARGQLCRAEKTARRRLAELRTSSDVEEKLALLTA